MQKKDKFRYFFLLFFFSRCLYAQVGIGTPSPSPSAMLHVNAAHKGGSSSKRCFNLYNG